jgi:pimeloyl-ACP methyl ester carboxylesterase
MQETDFDIFHVRTDDGLTLYGRDYGTENAGRPPIVCLAGLSRNSRDFHQFALRLSQESRRVIALDYRGRGLSDWDVKKENYNIAREAQDVVLALDSLGIDKAAFVGTSRGGLILHILGAMIGDRIAAIVLNDIGPVIESDGLRRIRDYLSARAEPADLGGAAAHLQKVHGAEFPALAASDWDEMAEAIYREIDGKLVADFDPALVEPLKAMDFSKPLADLWPQFDSLAAIPLLIVRGENSSLLSQTTVRNMLARHPMARSIVAAGQGHAPLLHLPDIYATIREFLAG